MARVLTDADRDHLVRLYLTGQTILQAGTAVGIGYTRARNELIAAGVPMRGRAEAAAEHRKLSAERTAELVSRYQAGESTKTLGPAFGMSSRVVSDYLRRSGIQARPKHVGITGLTAAQRSRAAGKALRTRWDNATDEDRAAWTRAAHDATRGVERPREVHERIAATKQRRGGSDSRYEAQVAAWLTERGVQFRQQVAVGPYVVDIAIGNVAVEITTGWARRKKWSPRLRELFDAGWHLYAVWHDTRDAMRPDLADDLVAWCKILESSPPASSQHRVIWRSRQILSAGGADADQVARIFKSARPLGHWPLYQRPRNDA